MTPLARPLFFALATLSLTACAGTGPMVRAARPCADERFSIYFDSGSTTVTPEAAALVRAAARRARACTLNGVDVLGLADTTGTPDGNQALSEQRVRSVTAALGQAGLSEVRFDTAAAGEAGSETLSGHSQPLRRRADIVLHLAPRP